MASNKSSRAADRQLWSGLHLSCIKIYACIKRVKEVVIMLSF